MNTKPTASDLQTILNVNGYQPHTLKVLSIVDVIPKNLNWILDHFSDDAPFSFGDANYTLLDGRTILDHIDTIWANFGDDYNGRSKKALLLFEKVKHLLELCFDANVYINVE